MRNVFELTREELEQLVKDTHFITDIQCHVEQFLMANNATRPQLKLELENFGPRAVPGILSAAYVFHDLLEDERQRDLSTLLARLVGSNAAARAMLVSSGVVEAPFAGTRATALLALRKLGDIQAEELDSIRKRAWDNAYMDENYQGVWELYRFLADQKDSQCCSEVRYIASEAFKKHLDIAPRYLDLALCCAPQNTYEILMETLGKMDREATGFDVKIQQMSAASVANFSEVLRAASAIYDPVRRTRAHAHKGLESLFTGPIQKFFGESPEKVMEWGDLMRQKYPSPARFFWQCLGGLLIFEVVKQYFITHIPGAADEFSPSGAVQLFFIQKYNDKFSLWAKEQLERLERDAFSFYSDAHYQFDGIRPRPPKPNEPTGPTQPQRPD